MSTDTGVASGASGRRSDDLCDHGGCDHGDMAEFGVDEAVRLRSAVSRLARRFNATATDEGLTPTQASVLGSVNAHAPVGAAELVELEHINPTMLSRVITALGDAGLVRRRQNPGDLRAALFEPTPLGKEVHQRVKAQRAELVLKGVAQLSATEQEILRAALSSLETLTKAVS